MDYNNFIEKKSQLKNKFGFKPLFIPEYLFDFQKHLLEWSCMMGRCAEFADCGLGKTILQLAWAKNIVKYTNKPVLILTPLAVSHQTVREGEKFGIECKRSGDGKLSSKITITNYERLHYFDSTKFIGIVCDESGILKHFSGATQKMVTNFAKKIPYRLLGTATAAPNDYIELGTSSEALGVMGYMDMLNRFFKNTQNTADIRSHWQIHGYEKNKWRFKRHAETPFWKWVCSWARAIRKPSDLGFNDNNFKLPPLIEKETILPVSRPTNGRTLIPLSARGLKEERQERRATIKERCQAVAEKINNKNIPAIIWCHLNDEGNLLEKIIPDAIQVSGSDKEEKKEEAFINFINGNIRVMITKPKIAGFGLNFQHCNYMITFPSHSWEQYYQSTRRLWRFGQTKPVKVDIISTEGERNVLKNLQRKASQANCMFNSLIKYMNENISMPNINDHNKKIEVPSWLL